VEAATPWSSDRRRLPAGLRRAVVTAGAVVLLAHVVMLWTAPFHSQDGPAHMFATVAWQRLLTGDGGTLADVYTVNTAPDPNWITYPLLSVLLRIAPVRQAELVTVAGLAVGTAAALYHAVTAKGRETAPVAVAGIAVGVGWSLHTGLYNFTASVALLLVVIGYALRIDGRVHVRSGLVLAGLTLLLYFSHPLSLTGAYVTVGALVLSAAVADARTQRSWRLLWVRGAALVAVVSPSVILLLAYLADSGTVAPRETPRRIGESLTSTVLLRWPLQVTRGDVGWITGLAAAVWVVVLALVVRRLRHRDWNRMDVLLVVALATGGGAVLLPDRMAGGSLVQPRLAIYALVTLLLWIGVANADVGLAHLLGVGLGAVGAVVMVGLLVARAGPYREIATAVDEVVGVAEAVPAGSTMLGAVSSRAPHMSPVVPLVHITDMVAVAADAVPVATLDAGSGYGPITYRERFDPDPALRGYPRSRTHGRQVSPTAFRNVVRRYATVTGEPFDYILLVAYRLSPEERQEFTTMGFRLVRRTPTGLAHLYQVTPRVLASVSEPVGGGRRVLASVSEPVGGGRRVLASVSEPVGRGRS
jgi:hypothetical protein